MTPTCKTDHGIEFAPTMTKAQPMILVKSAVGTFIISVNNDSSSSDDDNGTGSDGRGDVTSKSDNEIEKGTGIAVL
ncbi:hypothetical protein J6590_068714 [Homalodisca vitripennis]|nr:hypothetical protein J6590_068714 [Homalodisca vitripennis]